MVEKYYGENKTDKISSRLKLKTFDHQNDFSFQNLILDNLHDILSLSLYIYIYVYIYINLGYAFLGDWN